MEPAGVLELAAGRLYALANPLEIDARSSWYPSGTRGTVPITSYLLVEGDGALLIDTGVTVHRDALLRQVAHVLGPARRLQILHTRIGEYDGTCNTTALLERFGVRTIYGAVPDCVTWTDFATGLDWRARGVEIESLSLRRQPVVAVDRAGRRTVTATLAPLRLLPTFWVYDETTRALFTSDLFSHVVPASGRDGWLVTADRDDTSPQTVRRHLLATRYWWLADADPEPIRQTLAASFAEHAIDLIGPSYGGILAGRDVVDRHIGMLDAVLAAPVAA